ncbi:calpain protease-like protein [Leptomonas pyrrhocoris]|uniref:Calpain protease-like protein n=1 Tax=Leptomonas pyrrhocoris TaxID=157538 RepID=A0A0M9G301_LEPPY|nr:calpain protease-like protein [Leptomonas pyrrhocoris]KPA81119.1 calpain protease-like protein [Leptomonas pyrrhocoris]|eukprot:XP_015659558.1 calpain protease-like protein [Leptomonas pyrrhocoris]
MPSSFSAEATMWMQNAVQLDTNGRYVEAEECYTKAIFVFRQALQDLNMSDAERQSLMNYMSDVAKRIQRLRALNRNAQVAHAAAFPNAGHPPDSNVTSPAGSPGRHASIPASPQDVSDSGRSPPPLMSSPPNGIDNDLAVLGAIKISAADPGASNSHGSSRSSDNSASKPTVSASSGRSGPSASASPGPGIAMPASPRPPPADSNKSGGKPGGSPGTPPPSGGGGGLPPPPPPPKPFGAAAHFAPRTSEMVYKAIEVAIALSRQGELKRAVDVLQYAYTQGSRERNNPGNFKEIAETLKFMRQKYYDRYPPRFLQDNPILPAEMELLRKSGITSTILLPLWDDLQEGYGAENIFMPCEGVWEDAFTPKLCRKQITAGAKLMHFGDYQQQGLEYTIVRDADPLHIQQSVIGDCSLVCSLMICASYQKRFPNAKIISNVIYPQDRDGNPIINPKGKYCVKMLVNGITRIVTIDDRLPVRTHSKHFLCTSSTDPSELWVSLMEKAFVKICGGTYDFPGSVSYTDLYKLSGWLPDSTLFGKPEFDEEFQWTRLYQNFNSGALLFTVSTPSDMPPADVKLGLATGHAYAVLDMQHIDKERVLLLRNPWGKQEWLGKFGKHDTSDISMEVRKGFNLTREQEEMGCFCIAYEDVIRCFDQCSLSWNPYMLYRTSEGKPRRPVRIACHGTFNYTKSTALMPQLHIGVVDAPKRTRMHLILSRHITDVTEFGRQYDKDDESTPYLALKVYDVTDYPSVAQHLGGKCSLEMCYCRRLASNADFEGGVEPLNDVIYRSSSARTFSFDCPAGSSNLVVVVSRTSSRVQQPFNFTVTLHTELEQMRLPRLQANYGSATEDANSLLASANATAGNPNAGVYMHMIPASALKYTSRLTGAWVKGKTCGGRTDAATYVFNPQYRLHLEQPSHVSLRLAVSGTESSCAIQLVRPRGSGDNGSGVDAAKARKLIRFDGRVGNGAKEGELVLESARYAFGGAVVDSAMPFCVCYDRYRSLGKLKWKQSKKVVVSVVTEDRKTESLVVYDVEETDSVSVLLLNVMKKGYAASPRASQFGVNGKAVALESTVAALFQLASSLGGTSLAATPPPAADEGVSGARSVTVTVVLGPKSSAIKNASSAPATRLKDLLHDIVSDVVRCASQFSSFVPRLTYLARQAKRTLTSPADADVRDYILEAAAYLGDYVKTWSSAVRHPQTPQTLLPVLPAGDYTLIPSLWDKGAPGQYDVMVETTQPHKLTEIPEEGNGLHETLVRGELRGGAPRLSLSLMKPGAVIRKEDPFFTNSKVQVVLPTRGLFASRLFVLMDMADAEAKGQPTRAPATNLSLFRVRDNSSMELVCASDGYSFGGIATPLVELEGKTPYLLVVSAEGSSTDKYLLRIYSNASCDAKLSQ